MKVLALAVCALGLVACATQGPGAGCDPCAQAEATPVGSGSQAAAAAATGGQRANQAPFAEDTARLAPQTTIGRGQGATTSSSSDRESRQVASGGAQNLGVVLPTQAEASNGGIAPAVSEAAKTVAAYRSALQCALLDPTTTTERLSLLSEQLSHAQESLAAAQASAVQSSVTNHNFQGSRIQLFGISTSKTGPDEAINPEVVRPMAEAAASVLDEPMPAPTSPPSEASPSSPLLVPAPPELLPSAPPAGEPQPVPAGAGGGQ